jgi:hypothetical protein
LKIARACFFRRLKPENLLSRFVLRGVTSIRPHLSQNGKTLPMPHSIFLAILHDIPAPSHVASYSGYSAQGIHSTRRWHYMLRRGPKEPYKAPDGENSHSYDHRPFDEPPGLRGRRWGRKRYSSLYQRSGNGQAFQRPLRNPAPKLRNVTPSGHRAWNGKNIRARQPKASRGW